MKKILSAVLAAITLFSCAFALKMHNYPAFSGTIADNQLGGTFGDEAILLNFDASADFSMCENGYLQACFYTTNASNDSYIELYLLFPQNVKVGDVISPAYAIETNMLECCVCFYEVNGENETVYIAEQINGRISSEGTNYEIRIESFEESDRAFSVRGTVNAVLSHLTDPISASDTLPVKNAAFHFTMPKSTASARPQTPDQSAAPQLPQESAAPSFPTPSPAPDDPAQTPEETFDPFSFFMPRESADPFAVIPQEPAKTLPPFFEGMPKSAAPTPAMFTLPPDFARI